MTKQRQAEVLKRQQEKERAKAQAEANKCCILIQENKTWHKVFKILY